MKSITSYFSISPTLIRENLKRFWAIPVLGFIALFLSVILPVLMSYDKLRRLSDFLYVLFENSNPGCLLTMFLLPVVTAAVLFKYLHGTGSMTMIHSLPLSRSMIFNSNILSGLILTLAPVIANGAILMCLSKPVYDSYSVGTTLSPELRGTGETIFDISDILQWTGQIIVVIFLAYAICIFAGMVSGTFLMHIFNSVLFIFLPAILEGLVTLYLREFLYGFYSMENWILYLCPYVALPTFGHFSLFLSLKYIVAALVIYVLSMVIYRKRHLEKAGDSIVFRFLEPVLNYLIAFIGMTLVGFFFYYFLSDMNSSFMLAGLAVGGLLFFIIGRMIIKKSFRVFDLRALRSFAVYVVIASLFVATVMLDLTGFEKRVPDVSSVKNAQFHIEPNDSYDRFDETLFNSSNGFLSHRYTSSESINAIRAVHKYLIANKPARSDIEEYYADIYYQTKTGLFRRNYTVTSSIIPNMEEHIAALYESKEYKKVFSFDNLKISKLTGISIHPEYASAALGSLDQDEFEEFVNCLNSDFADRSFNQQQSDSLAYVKISFMRERKDGKEVKESLKVHIKASDSKTIAWLKDKGYYENLLLTDEMIKSIEIESYDADKNKTITDKDQINDLLELKRSGKADYGISDDYDDDIFCSYPEYGEFYSERKYYCEINLYNGTAGEEIWFEIDTLPDSISLKK